LSRARRGGWCVATAAAGRSSAEHLIAALRCLYAHAVADGRIDQADNPAGEVAKPRRLPSTRRAVPDTRRRYYRRKLAAGKTPMGAMRALKRRLADIVYRRMVTDASPARTGPGGHTGATVQSSAADPNPKIDTSEKSLPGPAEDQPGTRLPPPLDGMKERGLAPRDARAGCSGCSHLHGEGGPLCWQSTTVGRSWVSICTAAGR
jgi:hypothetical protein